MDHDVTFYALDGDQKQITRIHVADKEVRIKTDSYRCTDE